MNRNWPEMVRFRESESDPRSEVGSDRPISSNALPSAPPRVLPASTFAPDGRRSVLVVARRVTRVTIGSRRGRIISGGMLVGPRDRSRGSWQETARWRARVRRMIVGASTTSVRWVVPGFMFSRLDSCSPSGFGSFVRKPHLHMRSNDVIVVRISVLSSGLGSPLWVRFATGKRQSGAP